MALLFVDISRLDVINHRKLFCIQKDWTLFMNYHSDVISHQN